MTILCLRDVFLLEIFGNKYIYPHSKMKHNPHPEWLTPWVRAQQQRSRTEPAAWRGGTPACATEGQAGPGGGAGAQGSSDGPWLWIIKIIFAQFAFRTEPPEPPGWLLKQQVPLCWAQCPGRTLWPGFGQNFPKQREISPLGGSWGQRGGWRLLLHPSSSIGMCCWRVALVQIETYRK